MPDLNQAIAKWQLDVVALTQLCGQRILVVTDGLSYDPNDGFGLTEFLSIIAATPAWNPHVISTADRFGDPNATITGNFNFFTAALPVTRANYDQLWLFGAERAVVISNAERRVIAQFMEDGGGVFATGDHENLGFAMCSNLPRVRGMREWSAIPVGSETRLDTIVYPGKDVGFQFHDQSDNTPQKIFPHFTGTSPNFVVHPVLRSPVGVIDVMPDHPHESECLIPTVVNQTMAIDGKNFLEYPLNVNGNRPLPVKVSTSVSGGRFLTDALKPPVIPRCFLGITAYDGDQARVGRIVCDSTWHHFININLNGKGNPLYNPMDFVNGKNGLYDNFGNPTADYKQIKRYFQNMVKWLAPVNRRNCLILTDLLIERYRYPLREELLPEPHPCPWDLMVKIGKQTSDALDRAHGTGRSREIIQDLVTINGIEGGLAEMLRDERFNEAGEREKHLLPLSEIQLGLLGSVMNTVALQLPSNPNDLKKTIKDEKSFGAFGKDYLYEGLKLGLKEAAKGLAVTLKNSARMVDGFTKPTTKKLK
ncbi:MAG TPA: hypothetical protein VGO50_00295 [Pyrinomonadaceae bacterium]|jgi:hypothetical protein|nr:hypothetical protein [Pyrinomonadaceae bacterium]